ncbi:reverse transcriptase domain-containing protein [Tanacetum coccineum]
MSNDLADLGASIIIIPYSLFKRLGPGSLKPIKMAIKMADRSMQSPKGIKENVLVKISNFVFPVFFIILDNIEDENVLIILGRPMLATAHEKIDIYGKKISLGVGNDQGLTEVLFGCPFKEQIGLVEDRELALMCGRMFPEESDEVEKYVDGLPDMIQGSVMASKPKKMQDAIKFATELMDQKIRTLAERQAKNKKKFEYTSRNNQNQQQPSKMYNVARAYTAGPREKKPYRGPKTL